ncbi:MAG: class I tRNA ligase family protein, partial [Planctomycetota bacterium]
PARPVHFLTGTDEHADKVSRAALSRDLTPIEWATQNAEQFKAAFAFMRFTNSDFIRTTEPRHIDGASDIIARLMDAGEIALGDYEGWYDPAQEEYLTETDAREHDFKSPVTGTPLEKRTEQNYFFDLPKHADWLREQIETDAIRVLPEARKNEVLGRIKQGLQRVPVSRRVNPDDPEAVRDWGIRMPGDSDHRVYVWIEALCNYVTALNDAQREQFWPAAVHFMAKDILWFHAVIWPAMLRALEMAPPKTVYAHAYFVAEGKKMSKSLGNFIEIDQLRAYAERYSIDAVRWYLTTQGPLGANDADFSYQRFVEVYNADLANGIGNAASRVSNMIGKYFDGTLPEQPSTPLQIEGFDWPDITSAAAASFASSFDAVAIDDASAAGIRLVSQVDGYINATRPFSLAKQLDDEPVYEDLTNREALAVILCQCAEALRIASLFLYPAMPDKMAELWQRWGCSPLVDANDADSGLRAPLAEIATWGHNEFGLQPGTPIEKGDALFMRADANEDPPA